MPFGATKDTLIRRIVQSNTAAIVLYMGHRPWLIARIKMLTMRISYCVPRVAISVCHVRAIDTALDRAASARAYRGSVV